jgi:WD40 repeat protein
MLLLEGHTAAVTALTFSPDGQFLASGTKNGEVLLWDEELERRELWIAPEEDALAINGIEFSPDGQTVIVAGGMGVVGRKGFADDVFELFPPKHRISVTAVRFLTPTLLAVGFGDRAKPEAGSFELWDVSAERRKEPYFTAPHGVRAVAAHPGHKRVAWAEWGGLLVSNRGPHLFVWEITRPEPVRFNLTHNCLGLAFHPDGEQLAAAVDYTVRVFDLPKRQERFILKGHTGRVSGVAYSPDGRTLASGSWDGTVRLWDVATGVEKAVFQWPIGRVFALAYSPDGLRLAAGGDTGAIMLWDVG